MSNGRRWTADEIAADPTYPHGEYRGYGRGCRCEPCTRASYLRNQQYRKPAGWQRYVPSGPTFAHVRRLLDLGYNGQVIGDAAGIAADRVWTWEQDGWSQPHVQAATERAVLSVTPDRVLRTARLGSHVPIRKTAQRAHSMRALGYTWHWQAARLGYTDQTSLPFLVHGYDTVTVAVALRVAALAGEVGDRWATPEVTGIPPVSIKKALNGAARAGWFPPGAYDVHGFLIPGAARTPENLARDAKIAKAERQVEVKRLAADGVPNVEIAERLGIPVDVVVVDRKRPLSRVGAAALAALSEQVAA